MTVRYHTDERSPPLRIRTTTWADSPNLSVVAEERRDREWCHVGIVEVGKGRVSRWGWCIDDVVAEWSYIHRYDAGDCVKVSRRLSIDERSHGRLTLEIEAQRRQVSGDGGRQHEHDWLQQRVIDLEAPGVTSEREAVR